MQIKFAHVSVQLELLYFNQQKNKQMFLQNWKFGKDCTLLTQWNTVV